MEHIRNGDKLLIIKNTKRCLRLQFLADGYRLKSQCLG